MFNDRQLLGNKEVYVFCVEEMNRASLLLENIILSLPTKFLLHKLIFSNFMAINFSFIDIGEKVNSENFAFLRAKNDAVETKIITIHGINIDESFLYFIIFSKEIMNNKIIITFITEKYLES